MKSEIHKFCKKHNITEDQFFGKIKIGGSLDLSSLTSIPESFNPTVGGSLYLSSLTSIPESFNPTVGGSLDLSSLTSIPESFNPTVGGDIDLSSLTSIPESFNPTVGGDIDLRSGIAPKAKKQKNKLLFWKNGKYVSADGLFTEVMSKKGNLFKVRKIHSSKEFYLVTDGNTHAHGDTIKKAKEDFRFKITAEKLKQDPINPDTVITIQYYRIITGSCEAGVKDWIDKVFNTKEKAKILKSGIKAQDLLPLLVNNNAYGLERFRSLITF